MEQRLQSVPFFCPAGPMRKQKVMSVMLHHRGREGGPRDVVSLLEQMKKAQEPWVGGWGRRSTGSQRSVQCFLVDPTRASVTVPTLACRPKEGWFVFYLLIFESRSHDVAKHGLTHSSSPCLSP